MRSATASAFEAGEFPPEAHCVFIETWLVCMSPVVPAGVCPGRAGLGLVVAGGTDRPVAAGTAGGTSASVPGWVAPAAVAAGCAAAGAPAIANFQLTASVPTTKLML